MTLYEKLSVVLPFLGWVRGYQWKSWLIWDLLAGVTVGFMVVPQVRGGGGGLWSVLLMVGV